MDYHGQDKYFKTWDRKQLMGKQTFTTVKPYSLIEGSSIRKQDPFETIFKNTNNLVYNLK